MGLLDWLTDGLGTIGSQSASVGSPPPDYGAQPPAPPQSAPAVPPQAPPQAFPAGGAPPLQSSPPVMQPPAMQPPPPAPPQATLPPNSAPTSGSTPLSPSPQTPGMPTAAMPPNPGVGRGFLGQAFGMNSADEKNTLAGLGAGLKSVGSNWNKPGLAAFSGSAGAAIEGGQTEEHKRIDDMIKLIAQKQKAGDDSNALSLQKVKLETAQLQLQNLKDGNGKGSSWNKPPQQLYQDAMRLAQNDPNVKASEKQLEQTIKDGKPAEIAQAKADHAALVAAVQDKHLTGVGLPPQSAAGIAKQPGLTSQNPIPQAAFNGKPFNQVVKPQPYDQYFVDENGQTRVLKATTKGDASKPTGAPKASAQSSTADAADEDD